MSDKDTLDTLSFVNDQVSDTPPEPDTESSGAAENGQHGEEGMPAGTVQTEEAKRAEDGGVSGGLQQSAQPEDGRVQDETGKGGQDDRNRSETFQDTIAAQAGRGQERQEEHAQTGYSYGQPGYGPDHSQGRQGNPWGPDGFNGSERQGTPPPPGYPYNNGMGRQRKRNNNTMAMASLVLGILSVLLCCCGGFGIILGAIGIVLAILSRGREPMETSAKAGMGLSIGGIVLGIIVLVMAFAVIGNNEFRYDLYQRSQGNYEDYEDFSRYFDHNGM